jgi:L-lactate dehydrogenase
MITAGVNERAGGATDRSDPSGRLRLLDANAAVYRDACRVWSRPHRKP